MNMIEQIATALNKSYCASSETFNGEELARVAINAMLEPTEELKKFEIDDNLFDWNCNCFFCGGHKFAVQSYIRQALKNE